LNEHLNFPTLVYSSKGFIDGLAAAHGLYAVEHSVIVMLVMEDEVNIYSQLAMIESLKKYCGITMKRYKFQEIIDGGKLVGERFFINDEEVSVLYMRAGYSPEHFKCSSYWEPIRMAAKSRTIMCPSLSHYLVCFKKIQQVLADPDVLARFVQDQEKRDLLRSVFVEIYQVDDSTLDFVKKSNKEYLLKPQREGGGNNVFEPNVIPTLESMNKEEQQAWILMERIDVEANAFDATFLTINESDDVSTVKCSAVGEFGIFGVLLCDGPKIYINEAVGNVIRCKKSGQDEGGVFAGYGAFSSIAFQMDS